ncbi:hypothetical protein EJ08DRAFT_733477 [Tothia fuscella]|uniref:BTB domain-containing protein n=1 Tax=Tothia fuscella TaxID=1048955 RepID=A0A9P4NU41_9PEZI|nr:hypothetical protein EJ08DRAFT_733477 [Tothia fuscella]
MTTESPQPKPDWLHTVTVRVGPSNNQREYLIHEEVLSKHSPFFRRKISQREYSEIHLPSIVPETFEQYVHWVYSHRITAIKKDAHNAFYLMICCNILGHYLQDTDFQDATIDALQVYSLLVGSKAVIETKYVYANTPKDAPLRRLVIDMLVYEDYSEWFVQQNGRCYTEEALHDGLAKALKLKAAAARGAREDAPYKQVSCHYHEHEDKPCYRQKTAFKFHSRIQICENGIPGSFLCEDEHEIDFTNFITVHVGGSSSHPETKQSTVHEAPIRKQSPFFEAALSRNWKEAGERVVRLPYQDVKAFQLYVNWIYTHRIVVPELKPNRSTPTFMLIFRAYVLSDMLQDADCKDAILHACVDFSKLTGSVPIACTKFVYENTGRDAPVRRLLVDYFVHGEYETKWLSSSSSLPVEALVDVTTLFRNMCDSNKAKIEGNKPAFLQDMCEYHEHGKDRLCYKTKHTQVLEKKRKAED